MLGAASLWSMIGPVSKLAFHEGVMPMEVAFWRAALAWGFFGGHAVITKQTHLERKDIPALVFFSLTGITLFYSSYQLAVKSGGAALAAMLLYTAPAWVAIMSRLFFKESLSMVTLIALVATLLGVCGVSLGVVGLNDPEIRLTPAAIIFGLLSGFSYSLYYILGKIFSDRYTSANFFLYILPLGALILLPWVHFAPKTLTAWVCLFFLAFLCTYGAYYCYYAGLQRIGPTRASITATLEPVLAALTAYLWWDEYFTVIGYVGSFLILGAVVVIVRDDSKG